MVTVAPPTLPSDALVELTADLIDEGTFLAEINAAIAEASGVLDRRRAAGTTHGKCKITATIEVGNDPDLEGHVRLTYHVLTKTPKNERTCLARNAGGRFLCQADGARDETTDQLQLFNRKGDVVQVIDRRTGELLDPPDVAGKVGANGSK